MTPREQLVKEIEKAQDRLDSYDAFFDSLEIGQTIYEELTYDSSPVTVLSWNKEEGTVHCEYLVGGEKEKNDIPYYKLALTPRLTYF